MDLYRRSLLALFFATLNGCASWSEPTASPAPPAAASVNSPLPDQWWTLYRDPALNAAVEQALIHNRDLQVAAANLLQARAWLQEADAQGQPQTAFSADAGYGSSADDQLEAALNQSSHIRTGSRYHLGLAVAWELDLFGRLQSLSRAAQADAESAQAAADGLRVLVAAQTTGAWLDACNYARRASIARHALSLAERSQALASSLHSAGAGSALEVARAQERVGQLQARVPALEAGRQRALGELALLMGRPPGAAPSQALACQAAPTLAASMPSLDGLAVLRQRPDVRQAERQFGAATARIGVARADLYPRVSLGANVLNSAHHPDGYGDSGATVWSLGPLLSWSFPNLSSARARIAQASAMENAALARFDGTLLAALKELQQALVDYDAALRQQQAWRQAAQYSAERLRLAALDRAAGASTAQQYLKAQRRDVQRQAELAGADAQVMDAQLLLFKAMGGGWREAPPIARATRLARHSSTPPESEYPQ